MNQTGNMKNKATAPIVLLPHPRKKGRHSSISILHQSSRTVCSAFGAMGTHVGWLPPATSTALNPQEQKFLFSMANKDILGLFCESKRLNMPLSSPVDTDLSGLENMP